MRALAVAVLSSLAACGAAAQQPVGATRVRPRTVIAIIEGDTNVAPRTRALADYVRSRLERLTTRTELLVQSRRDVENTLLQGGPSPSTHAQFRELAHLLNADLMVDVVARETGPGASARAIAHFRANLPPDTMPIVEGATVDGVGDSLTREILALTRAVRPTLEVTRARTAPGDLSSIRVFDAPRHLTFRIYYDTVSENVARSSINVLDDIYAELARITGAAPGKVEWAAVAFVANRAYEPPRIGNEVRWSVAVEPDGLLATRGERDLFQVLPHEQVHAVQSSLSLGLPRWFSEGQAEWAGVQVTKSWRPALAATRSHETASTSLASHRLAAWGGVIVSRDAILRQMTPEQREHHARDSTWMPPGPYKFGPADLVSDESDAQARYGAASALFAELEAAKGASALQSWFAMLWREPEKWTTPALVETIRKTLGADVEPKLR